MTAPMPEMLSEVALFTTQLRVELAPEEMEAALVVKEVITGAGAMLTLTDLTVNPPALVAVKV